MSEEVNIIPKILGYENGAIFITPEAMMIPELKAIVDKYGEEEAKPYLGYAHLMTWIYSPYRNYEDNEKVESVVYDVTNTIGDLDIDEPLLTPAVAKLTRMNNTALSLWFSQIEQELHGFRLYMKNSPISDDTVEARFKILEKAGNLTASYNKTKQAAEEELKVKGRGKAKIGDYYPD